MNESELEQQMKHALRKNPKDTYTRYLLADLLNSQGKEEEASSLLANHPIQQFKDLVGCMLTEVWMNEEKDRLRFTLLDGREFFLFHRQNCCEHVVIEDLCGDVADLLHSPITLAEEQTNGDEDTEEGIERWTFYRIGTVRGVVTIRWHGSSNGYYSVSVGFEEVSYAEEEDW